MLPHPSPINEKINNAVSNYAENIIARIALINSEVAISSSYNMMFSEDGTQSSYGIALTTDFGAVAIIPDFFKESAGACIINTGLYNSMKEEGFSDEEIENSGKIYLGPLYKTENNLSTLSKYLSFDLDLSSAPLDCDVQVKRK